MDFQKGDWVSGRSRDGELIHGYIVDLDQIQDIMKVFVIKSDNTIIIGKTVWILNKYAEMLKLSSSYVSEDDLLPLIDLALITKDEAWFMELTQSLKTVQKVTEVKEKQTKLTVNRLANIDTTY